MLNTGKPEGVAKHNHTYSCLNRPTLFLKYSRAKAVRYVWIFTRLQFHVVLCISDDRPHGLVMAFVAKALSELMFC
jgi:hypothetical protein